MPTAAGRRVGCSVLAGLVAGVILLPLLPGDPGSIRIAGVGAFWWLAIVVAPLVATLTVAALPRPPSAGLVAVAAWAGPAVLVTVAARVFGGLADAPVLALLVLVAPLAALLPAPAAPAPAPSRIASLATLAGAALALAASFMALADVAEVLSVRRWQAAVLTAALALLASEWRPRGGDARPAPAGALVLAGAAGFVLPLVVVAAAVGAAPWSEWRLGPGDALTLRPGDRLVLEAGARVRFEAGKRVPGAPASGAEWADPPGRRSPQAAARALGAALTLAGGALVMLRASAAPSPAGARAAPVLLLVLVLAAVAWGVYAAGTAPDLALGAPGRAGLVELPARAVSGLAGRALTGVAVVSLLVLSLAGACALRGLAGSASGSARGASLVWAGLVVLAAAASVWPADAWR